MVSRGRDTTHLDDVHCILLDQLTHEPYASVIRRNLGLEIRHVILETPGSACARHLGRFLAQQALEFFLCKYAVAHKQEGIKHGTLLP